MTFFVLFFFFFSLLSQLPEYRNFHCCLSESSWIWIRVEMKAAESPRYGHRYQNTWRLTKCGTYFLDIKQKVW